MIVRKTTVPAVRVDGSTGGLRVRRRLILVAGLMASTMVATGIGCTICFTVA